MRVLGLIPARGGSKGIPRKNIRTLGGKPLLQWTAEAALASRTLTKVVLSTEDDAIAAVGRNCGLTVPFRRPIELAGDDTPTLDVIQHAIHALDELGDPFDAVCLLQPTSPFRKTSEIDACVDMFLASDADAVLSVRRVPTEYKPHWVYFRLPDGSLRLSTGEPQPIPRRQLLPAAFHRDGSLYVTRRHVIMDLNSLYGMRVLGYEGSESAINIDSETDWDRAEAAVRDLVS
ncbi:MAG: cytidylyltransferase domain-containing protein [Gemmatimonadaceae bacterium]